MKERDIYYDFIKGIAIVFVIGIHTYSYSGIGFEILRQVVNCAVPLFLAVSGYFIGKKEIASRKGYCTFLTKQIKRVYTPMLIFSIPWATIAILGGSNPMKTILFTFCCGMSIFYFIALIIQLYILTPVIAKVASYRWGGVILLLVSVVGIILWTIQKHILQLGLPMTISGAPFPKWLIYYAMGMIAASGRIPQIKNRILILGFLTTIVLSIIETNLSIVYDHKVPGMKVTALLYSCLIILIIFQERVRLYFNNIKMPKKLIYWTGQKSFYIYLSHCVFIMLLGKLSFYPSDWIIRWILIYVLSASSALILEKLFPERLYKYIGLK